MEYDLEQVQSDRHTGAEQQRLIHLAKDITGYIGLDGMAILTDRTDQVAPLKAALEARRDMAPLAEKPFKAVHALQDFVPPDQPAKIEIMNQIKDRVLRARRHHLVSDADWAIISRFLPPDGLRPWASMICRTASLAPSPSVTGHEVECSTSARPPTSS